MKISIMQPGYLPWLGFFELMAGCDLFVILDNVQYTKKDWRSRNRIRTKEGWTWLSVPVLSRHKKDQLITQAEINNTVHWRESHLRSLKTNYAKTKYFQDYISLFEDIYQQSWTLLVELDITIISLLSKQLDIPTPMVRASNLNIADQSGNQRILEICQKLNADELYDSQGARAFIDTSLFDKAGIKISFQEYHHPEYTQVYRPFMPYMSVVDLLFNEGPHSLEIILKGSV